MNLNLDSQFSQPTAGRFLLNRPNFFFDPPNDGKQGSGSGAPSNDSPTNQPPAADPPPNPFANIDKDLLDDRTRAAVEKAEGQIATLANQAKQSSTFQAETDRLKTELANVQKQVQQQADPGQHRPQKPADAPKTFEDEILETYVASGLDPKVAASLAKMNATLFDKHSARLIEQVDQRYQPVVANTLERNTVDAFNSAVQKDSMGIFQLPEISQKVWERAQEMSQRGQLVDDAVLQNLGRIFYFDYIETNGGSLPTGPTNGNSPAPNMRQSPAPPIGSNISTRHTFPGAGNNARIPLTGGRGSNGDGPKLTADERAAMAATVANWPVKPQEFKNAK